MTFRIQGLDPAPFVPLYGLSDDALKKRGVHRMHADVKPGYPDRVEMRDVEPGQAVLLLNYEHLRADTPYRSSHAVFVREGAVAAYDDVDTIPEVLRSRILSVRSIDSKGMMREADLVDGGEVEAMIERMLGRAEAAFLHIHYAKRGCFACRVDRA